jgi:formylglycine-generating enzyme required for sulfatase activity
MENHCKGPLDRSMVSPHTRPVVSLTRHRFLFSRGTAISGRMALSPGVALPPRASWYRSLSHCMAILRRAALSALVLLSFLAVLSACTKRDDDTLAPPSPAASLAASPAARSTPSSAPEAPLRDESVEIAGGAFMAGSVPGTEGRVPELEPRRYQVELGPFQVDRLYYPNDPAKPPLVGVSRDQARQLCAERGGRLCTELEWERACKGPESSDFSTGDAWDAGCAREPSRCATGFNVLAMASAIREWVDSDVVPADGGPRRAVVRGASASEGASLHRCATRRGIAAETKSDDLGFRCCKGAPNAAVVKEPRLGATFEKTRLSAKRLGELLATDPKTRALAKDLKFFREPDAANTVRARGPGNDQGFLLTVAPLVWNPTAGARYLVVAARSGEATSFVVVYYVLGKDDYRLASSFVMQDEPGPVALAYNGYIRPRLHFSTCWGCPGETGKILHRSPDSAVVLQP